MRDFARSADPAVQAQLDRLARLSLPQGRLGLDTVRALLARLGNPHGRLPPVFHVAGTNGKGSTCAYLRAILEAEGYRVHATISPHLVRYNERIRIAGALISDARLAEVLRDVLDAGEDLAPSFFEVTIAAAFCEFARVPADACVVEVGLGGRFDATNVLPRPAVCGIAALAIDHEQFLLAPEDGVPADPLARIAFEKAGIAKPGVPLVTLAHPPAPAEAVLAQANHAGARAVIRDREWFAAPSAHGIAYRDARGTLDLPPPALPGVHQADNAALAVAMVRHQTTLPVSPAAIATGIGTARWPARLQTLRPGPLTALRPECTWLLDGGHNPDAAQALDRHLAAQPAPVAAIVGMLANKDWRGFIDTLAPRFDQFIAVPVPGHEHAPLEDMAARAQVAGAAQVATANSVAAAARQVTQTTGTLFVGGSLYLAGTVLAANGELPD